MPNTYFDSDLTGAQIEAALNAIHGVITSENNGKVLAIEDGAIVAKSASEWTDTPVLESVTITENGTTTPPTGVDGFNSVTVNVQGGGSAVVQPLSVTQNGTYNPPSGVDGYAPVIVNVQGGGGGGTNSITVSPDNPTAENGNINDLWVVSGSMPVSTLQSQTLQRKYTISITVAGRDSDYSFSYYGARELQFIFDDGNGNDVLLQDIDSNFTFSGRLNKNTLFDKSLAGYTESSGLPAVMTASLTVPAGYTLKGFLVGWRNDSAWKDFWRTFSLTETFVFNGEDWTRTVLNKKDMVYDQWNVGPYVDFTADMEFSPTAKSEVPRFIKLATGWTSIQSLDEYINYI